MDNSCKQEKESEQAEKLSDVFVVVESLSHIQLLMTAWTVAFLVPLSMGFSRQEYWSGLPFPSPENLPDGGIEAMSPALKTDSLPLNHQESPGGSRMKENWHHPCKQTGNKGEGESLEGRRPD